MKEWWKYLAGLLVLVVGIPVVLDLVGVQWWVAFPLLLAAVLWWSYRKVGQAGWHR